MPKMADEDIRCKLCLQIYNKMKRCTRCKIVYYCSEDCQLRDWLRHKETCGTGEQNSTDNQSHITSKNNVTGLRNTCSHSTTDHSKEHDKSPSPQHSTLKSRMNFEKAAKDLKTTSQPTEKSVTQTLCENKRPFYYVKNVSYYDVPIFVSGLSFTKITVKCEKSKKAMLLNDSWHGEEIYKYLSSHLEIPLEKLKIITKGKVMTKETICNNIRTKAVFQIIGEMSANEEGLDKDDIECMMKQLDIERNMAVNTLRQKGNLIDAIIEIGNKK